MTQHNARAFLPVAAVDVATRKTVVKVMQHQAIADVHTRVIRHGRAHLHHNHVSDPDVCNATCNRHEARLSVMLHVQVTAAHPPVVTTCEVGQDNGALTRV